MLSCKQATALISLQQDRRLNMVEQWRLRTHLLMCRHCRRYQTQIKTLQAGMAQLRTQWPLASAAVPTDEESNPGTGGSGAAGGHF